MYKRFISLLSLFTIILSTTLLAQYEKEVSDSFSLSENGEVRIETYKGTIDIETWDKNEVSVYAKIEADKSGWGGTDPEEQIENVRIDFNSSSNYLGIQSEYKKSHSWGGSNTRAFVHYKVKMPESASLKIKDYKSESNIRNVNSKVDFETYKGEVLFTNLKGSIDLETYKGDIEIDFADIKDDCDFETYKGTIKLNIPKSEGFNVDLDLGKKGDLRSDFDIDEEGRRSRDEVRGNVNGGGPYIEFSTYKGEIRLYQK